MLGELWPLLLMGCGLGMLHAFDADHVMAVTTLGVSNKSQSKRKFLYASYFYCLHWALGHGSMLLIIGLMLFVFDVSIPDRLLEYAELGVGLLLVLMGGYLLFKIHYNRIHFDAHKHGDIVHRHWHSDHHVELTDDNKYHQAHGPLFVGVLHGLAGSAPVMALTPILMQGHISAVLLYILVFSLGVMSSMLIFGSFLAFSQFWVFRRYPDIMNTIRQCVAIGSISLGGLWIIKAL
jgi:nickel/cobalt transporter (NicO) family protein